MSDAKKTSPALLSDQLTRAATGVLGSMLIDEAAVGPMLMAVTESDFQLPGHRSLFRAIKDLYGQIGRASCRERV